jgi:hypothetical protein
MKEQHLLPHLNVVTQLLHSDPTMKYCNICKLVDRILYERGRGW